ncbi:sulfurtransferase [Jeotgalibacillus campisalis]|uniref:3-mercaptopyruvate sulfurtransferase n=1 Tax=Jeotgalibacillus campisalis TaxID=220754 RepID=A0A0C2VUC3_9BACL|nr:sulfurtransferase [Jeotgalibacillus campisalis]KIL48011.1 3-mercaptopyruvate sulfurtransferase [Jeotgalibacillus campisalis]
MGYTVTPAWLMENLKNVVIADCRFSLNEPSAGSEQYKKGHIPGAVYFHLNKDLSGAPQKHGGRHPLPLIEDFKRTIEHAGISNESTVIVYDGGEGAFASRLWWLLRYHGLENVFILNGGFKEWEAQELPLSTEEPTPSTGSFSVHVNENWRAEVGEIEQIVTGKTTSILIDSRSYDRYIGQNEPIDRVAGHIPGAIHRDWMDGLHEGFFLKDSEQANRFSDWEKDRPIVVYCGSGVTAIPNFIALKQAGFENVKLYPGSYSDWVSYDEHEIEIGDSTHFKK